MVFLLAEQQVNRLKEEFIPGFIYIPFCLIFFPKHTAHKEHPWCQF